MTGMTSLLGYKDGVPLSSGIMHTDAIGGEMGFAALLIALHHRHRTGQGQVIELSQQEAAISFIGDRVVEFSMTGRVPKRQGNRDRWMAPHGNYRCRGAESWVAISVRSDAEWQRFCTLLGRQDLAEDPRFLHAQGRRDHADTVDELVEKWTLDKDAYAVMELLQGQGIPCAPVLKAQEVRRTLTSAQGASLRRCIIPRRAPTRWRAWPGGFPARPAASAFPRPV